MKVAEITCFISLIPQHLINQVVTMMQTDMYIAYKNMTMTLITWMLIKRAMSRRR